VKFTEAEEKLERRIVVRVYTIRENESPGSHPGPGNYQLVHCPSSKIIITNEKSKPSGSAEDDGLEP